MQYEPVEAEPTMSEFLRGAQKYRESVLSGRRITLPLAQLGCAAALLTASLLTGCAPTRPPVVMQQSAVAPAGPAYATVVAVRDIPASGAGGNNPRSAVLTAMGLAQTAEQGASSEIVVRTEDGAALSVVEPDAANPAANLKVGAKVMVVRGGLLRLVPAPPEG